MTLMLASVLLALLNLASAALIADRRRVGWLVALGAQVPWTWYDVWTRQLGFLLLTLLYVPVYVRGWRKVCHPTDLPSRQPVPSPAVRAPATSSTTRPRSPALDHTRCSSSTATDHRHSSVKVVIVG